MNKPLIITITLTLAIVGLLIWGTSVKKGDITYFKDTELACLSNGHQILAEHIHPVISITVDGEPEAIPANIGILDDCMSEIHTHDESGTIHAESFQRGRIANFNLTHFFKAWDKNIQRSGYDLKIMQDGVLKESPEDVKYIDHSQIELIYTSS